MSQPSSRLRTVIVWLCAAAVLGAAPAIVSAAAPPQRKWTKKDIQKKKTAVKTKAAEVKGYLKKLKTDKLITTKDYKAGMKQVKDLVKAKNAAVAKREKAYSKLFDAQKKWQRAEAKANVRIDVASRMGTNPQALRQMYKDMLRKDAFAFNKALTKWRQAEAKFTKYTGTVKGTDKMGYKTLTSLEPPGLRPQPTQRVAGTKAAYDTAPPPKPNPYGKLTLIPKSQYDRVGSGYGAPPSAPGSKPGTAPKNPYDSPLRPMGSKGTYDSPFKPITFKTEAPATLPSLGHYQSAASPLE